MITFSVAVLSINTLSAAEPLSRGDLYGYIAGKTQQSDDFTAFYGEDGALLLQWQGQRYKGTWFSTNEGGLCWQVYDLGELPCRTYFHEGEQIVSFLEGKSVALPLVVDGNQLQTAASNPTPDAQKNKPLLPERDFFSREQTIALLSGKTAKREPGGRMYYAPDFTLHTNWNGVRHKGTWQVTDEGSVCWQIAGWGPTPCESYFYKSEGGILWARFRGLDTAAAELVEGDQTAME